MTMMTLEDATDYVGAMIRQERKFYRCSDYLDADEPGPVVSPLHVVFECANLVTDVRGPPASEKEASLLRSPTRVSNFPSPRSSFSDLGTAVTDTYSSRSSSRGQTELSFISSWRHQMLDWASTVTLTYNVDRETIPVAFSILDRYLAVELASHQEPIDREDFQLFAMVSMYIAIKILVPFRKLALETLIDMSRGFYTAEDVTATEQDILVALDWHLHPPIVMEYCRCFMKLFPSELPSEVEETCAYISEMALDDTYFISKPTSLVALAAMLVAAHRHNISLNLTQGFLENLMGHMDVHSAEFDAILRRMEVLC
mmetsp:Transcript_132438/g.197366  ORF Transcript_132438/g.197366 Transcript_132438/m.197366 type:complete len:314 (+) Transcript_132438:93-1034(+)